MTAYLRTAKMSDHWRTLYKKKFNFQLKKIVIEDGSIFKNIELNLNGNLNVIIGKNGVGKTNFLRNIFNALNRQSESNRSEFLKILDKNDMVFGYQLNSDYKEYRFTHGGEHSNNNNQDINAYIFDPCCLIPELQNLFTTQENFEELIDQFEVKAYSQDKLEIINYLSNHEYSKVEVYNIEDEYENFPILPIFLVERNSLEYDRRAMGLGELSMFYCFWLLDYIADLDKNIVLIVEEPESFISPLLQKRFIDILVKYIVEKNLNCILSTHSDYILEKIPSRSLKKLTFLRNNESKFDEVNNIDILYTLGLSPQKKGLLFFEDLAAELLLKQLIKRSSFNGNENFYFHCSGDDSHVVKHINEMPKKLRDFKFVGVFDGDARTKVPRLLSVDTIAIFLPTDVAPEIIIMNYLGSCDFNTIDQFLNLNSGAFEAAYQAVIGADHHDFFVEISKILDKNFSSLFSDLCEIWIRDPNNAGEIKIFIEQFDAIFF